MDDAKREATIRDIAGRLSDLKQRRYDMPVFCDSAVERRTVDEEKAVLDAQILRLQRDLSLAQNAYASSADDEVVGTCN